MTTVDTVSVDNIVPCVRAGTECGLHVVGSGLRLTVHSARPSSGHPRQHPIRVLYHYHPPHSDDLGYRAELSTHR